MAGDVFISYSSKEPEIPKLIRKTLKSNGISCWMAPESIPSGSSYAAEIPKGIRECKIFLLVLSNNSQNSIWVPREIDEAINHGKTIIPFQIEECKLNDAFNFYLNQIQRITAYLELEGSLNELVEKIKKIIGIKEKPKKEEVPKQAASIIKNDKTIYPNGDMYKGEIKSEKRNGNGKMEYANGDVYEGLWKDDLKAGKGKLVFSNGDIYEGFFANDKFNGRGVYTYSNGSQYEGLFKDGVKCGKGKIKYKNGSIYEGNFQDDEPNGKGKKTNKDGSYYEGEFKCGSKHGKGKEVDAKGNIYEGTYEINKPIGIMKVKLINNCIYEGEILNYKFHGQGKLTTPKGTTYEGKWENGFRVGKHKCISENEVYNADCSYDEKKKTIKIIWDDGQSYEGEYKDGLYNGKGKYTFSNGA